MNAARFAEIIHKGQKRRTGDAYVSHLYAVRNHLIDAGITEPQILDAALLHDCLEDGDISKEYLSFRFGQSIADIVDALSKETAWHTNYCRMKSNLEALERAWVPYPEAIVIKIADRLHNLQTLDGFSLQKRAEYLQETTHELVPLFRKVLLTGAASKYSRPIQSLLDSLENEICNSIRRLPKTV